MHGHTIACILAGMSMTALGCEGHLGEGAASALASALDGPVLFDTPEADAILARLSVFPADNPWNEEIQDRPVHPDSSAIVASIGAETALGWNLDMNFVLVPSAQPRVPVNVVDYADESDPGPFPVPDNAPIEQWPLEGGSLDSVQRDGDGDRHLIVVDPGRGKLVELLEARRTDQGWEAAQTSAFDLTSNALRPEDWTSTDAAGLPIFPAIVRYDEVASGMVHHAMRFTAPSSRRAYVYPARHYASGSDDPSLPRMGERLRLRADFDTAAFPPHARAVLEGLKVYGMMMADNGLPWRISVAPDRRIQGLESLSQVHGSDFEVVIPTGPEEGPRAH
jgi:hypothetical protein